MQDAFNRQINYLRLSVTDRCDFRCVYCMSEQMTFLPKKEVLSLEELAVVAQAFVNLGVTKIRLTGGEPLIRQNVLSLVNQLGQMPIDDLSITTNGSRLLEHGVALKAAGVKRINVSLDSLNPNTFKTLTRHGDLKTVLAGLDHVKTLGFESIRINTVAMSGQNDQTLSELVHYALKQDFDIAFIEEMPLGDISSHSREQALLTSQEIRDTLQKQSVVLQPTNENSGGPARYWRIPGHKSRIGFISPMSHNFCETCNRVRVSAEGKLYLCLGNEHYVDLKPIVRSYSGPTRLAKLQDAINHALTIKPERHHFDQSDAPQIVRFMNTTGG